MTPRNDDPKRDLERKMETLARKIARERGQPEALWELFLLDAYRVHFSSDGTQEDRDAQE